MSRKKSYFRLYYLSITPHLAPLQVHLTPLTPLSHNHEPPVFSVISTGGKGNQLVTVTHFSRLVRGKFLARGDILFKLLSSHIHIQILQYISPSSYYSAIGVNSAARINRFIFFSSSFPYQFSSVALTYAVYTGS